MTASPTSIVSTTKENDKIRFGFASRGTLVVDNRGNIFRITGTRRKRYSVIDSAGREYTGVFHMFSAAPEGVVFAGPDTSPAVEAAQNFRIGDVVQMKKPASRVKFPGKYVVVKSTSPTRFKLQQIGGTITLTAPATSFEKVDV